MSFQAVKDPARRKREIIVRRKKNLNLNLKRAPTTSHDDPPRVVVSLLVTFSANLHQVKIDRTLSYYCGPRGPTGFCSLVAASIFTIRSRHIFAQSPWQSRFHSYSTVYIVLWRSLLTPNIS